jgi:hypothetical protein
MYVALLNNLNTWLDKAEELAKAKKFDIEVLLSARLAPDMFPLSRQIQIASDAAKGCVARLAGAEVPSWPDTETTFPELEARVAKTIAFVKGFTATQIDGSEERSVLLKMRSGDMTFRGQDYLFKLTLPNFYFHITTAYDILRHNGVEVGKMDYLGKLA